MSDKQIERWIADRARQATQHPTDHLLAGRMSRGDHYRRKNTGVALRTYLHIKSTP